MNNKLTLEELLYIRTLIRNLGEQTKGVKILRNIENKIDSQIAEYLPL